MESDPAKLPAEITSILRESLLVEVDAAEDDLLVSGTLDSLSLVQLMLSLEQHFSITIPLEQLELDDFRSVASIAQLVQRRILDRRAETACCALSSAVSESSRLPILTPAAIDGGEGQP